MRDELKIGGVIAGSWFLGEVVATAGGDGTPRDPVMPQREDILTVYLGLRQVIAEANGQWPAPDRVNSAGVAFYSPITSYANADALEGAINKFAKQLAGELPEQTLLGFLNETFTSPEGGDLATEIRERFAGYASNFARRMADLKVEVLTSNGQSETVARILVAGAGVSGRRWSELATTQQLGQHLPFKVNGRYWELVRGFFLELNSFAFDSDKTAPRIWSEVVAAIPGAPATFAEWTAKAAKKVAGAGLRTVGSVVRVMLSEFGGAIAIGAGALLLYRALEKRVTT